MDTKRVILMIKGVNAPVECVERNYDDGRIEYADLRGNVVPDSEILEVK